MIRTLHWRESVFTKSAEGSRTRAPLHGNLCDHFDDDCEVLNHYYVAKRMYPNIPFYLRDENGETFEFGWSLIYQYISKLTQENEEGLLSYPDY